MFSIVKLRKHPSAEAWNKTKFIQKHPTGGFLCCIRGEGWKGKVDPMVACHLCNKW